jgi:hypothetical protein
MRLAQYIGDKKVLKIPLRSGNADFEPAALYYLIFTVKAAKTDADASAIIQKTSDLGIEASDNYALITMLPVDTGGDGDQIAAQTAGTYFFDVKAQEIADPENVKTVAEGILELRQNITQLNETSIDVYAAPPGLAYDNYILAYI